MPDPAAEDFDRMAGLVAAFAIAGGWIVPISIYLIFIF